MTDGSDDRTMIRDNAARFAEQHKALGMLGRAAEPDRAAWRKALGEGGWTGLLASEAAGGSQLMSYDLCLVAEEFGRKLLPPFVPIAAAAGVAGARAMAEGALILPALQSEGRTPSPGHGGKAIKQTNGAYLLDGAKYAVPDGHLATGFVIDARGGDGVGLFYLPRNARGLTITTQKAVDGVSLSRLEFKGVVIPADDVLATGKSADAMLDRLRFPLQAGLAAELVGVAAELFDRTLDYLRTRRAFGRSLGAFQALQHRAVDIYGDLELARALALEAARVAEHAKPGTLELIAAARAKAGDVALRMAKWAVQMHGAMGFTDECDIGLYLKRAMALSRVYRTPEAHRQRFADASWAPNAPNLFELFRSESEADTNFRREVREFLDTTLPPHLLDLPTRPKPDDAVWWHRKVFERGWIAPAWPKEHGGMDATAAQRLILFEEMAIKGAPELSAQGIYHIGPIIIRFGTPEQKARLLPGTLSGDLQWCQGYSEPNSGSDLASLRTSARVDGDKLIINGQKIWTTGAHFADWMFALVRTDPDAADRREGISMIFIDMKAKGIRVRPIRTIAGDEEFCEVFFDNVEMPIENVVSGLNQGWKLANAVLETERLMSSSPQKVILMLDRVRRVARQTRAYDDMAFRDRLARAEIDVLAFSAAFSQVLGRVRGGQTAGPQVSILKILMADYLQTLADLMLEAAGSDGALIDPIEADGRSVPVGLSFLQGRRASIYGGTSEIQRNIIARRVLDLGNEPKKRL